MSSGYSVLNARGSAFDPAGPEAQVIADLTWWMIAVFGSVFIFVMYLVYRGMREEEDEKKTSRSRREAWFIWGGGVILPAVVVLALLVYSVVLMANLNEKRSDLTIRITGHMWWWDVKYIDSAIRTANEIYVPVGRRVRLELHSRDVIHSLWMPSLAGKMDLLPGDQNELSFVVSEPGVYRGQCAEYCGLQHARMGFFVIALEEKEFAAWQQKGERAFSTAPGSVREESFEVFSRTGCAECHAIAGTSAQGRIGPDLTLVGSRLTLGAGVVPNSFGAMAGWVSNPQALKPGNHMPRTYMSAQDLKILTEYLMELK